MTRLATTKDGRQIYGFVFNAPESAWSFCDQPGKPTRVMLGHADEDRNEWWVVTPADAARLEQMGYEYAPR
ncbi:hypothetical protein RAS1_42070 [Phycisphaerae bacterium RAS1]|nr:hypothetical protein RAS1_42070 [Phycisphaerae bacterium RAS1]